MKKNEKTEFYTNMSKGDPVIEKLMNDYVKEQKNTDGVSRSDDLIVNFDITYDDGKVESHTCGNESGVFGDKEYIEPKVDPEIEKCYREESVDDKDFKCNIDSEENEKWDNCKDEWYTGNKDKCDYYGKKPCHEKKDNCKEPKGEITVYSLLQCGESTAIKGIKINLYKLNGICPILVQSEYTDENGKVVFCELEEGSYRVIEMIDKKYFEKPSYIKWNEVTIDECNKSDIICIINKIRKCIRN